MSPLLYKVRYCKGSVFSALKVWFGFPLDPVTQEPLDRSPRWQVEFNGEIFDEPQRFLLHFQPDGTPVIAGEKIDEAEYDTLVAVAKWATQAPDAPEAKPRDKIDHLKGDLIF